MEMNKRRNKNLDHQAHKGHEKEYKPIRGSLCPWEKFIADNV
jgi:hypothetical protein